MAEVDWARQQKLRGECHDVQNKKIAESSAESELYALASARETARNFRLLIHESFSSSLAMSQLGASLSESGQVAKGRGGLHPPLHSRSDVHLHRRHPMGGHA